MRLIGQLAAPAFLEEETVGWVSEDNLAAPWNSFLYPVIRLAFLLARPFGDAAPLVTSLAMVAGIALVAAFLASDRMADAIPDQRVRLASAVGLAALPYGDARIYTTTINLHWFLAIYLGALLLATPTVGGWRIVDRIGALAAFSVPAVMFLAPLYLWRRRHVDRWVLAVVLSGAAAQVASMLLSPRASGGDPLSLAGHAIVRMGLAPLGDRNGWVLIDNPALGIALALLVLAAALLLRDRLPAPTVVVFGVLAAALGVAGMSTGIPDQLSRPDEAARYFVVGAWLLLTIAAAGLVSRRPAGVVLGALLVFGIMTTFILTPH